MLIKQEKKLKREKQKRKEAKIKRDKLNKSVSMLLAAPGQDGKPKYFYNPEYIKRGIERKRGGGVKWQIVVSQRRVFSLLPLLYF